MEGDDQWWCNLSGGIRHDVDKLATWQAQHQKKHDKETSIQVLNHKTKVDVNRPGLPLTQLDLEYGKRLSLAFNPLD